MRQGRLRPWHNPLLQFWDPLKISVGSPELATPRTRLCPLRIWTPLEFYFRTPCKTFRNSSEGPEIFRISGKIVTWHFKDLFLKMFCSVCMCWPNCQNVHKDLANIKTRHRQMMVHHGWSITWFLIPPWALLHLLNS